jgi:hypothetical protein
MLPHLRQSLLDQANSQLITNCAAKHSVFTLIMQDKYRGIDVSAAESANALKRMHVMTARSVGTVDVPQWAQDMQLVLVNLNNTMQQRFLHVNQRLDHFEEIVKGVKVGMNCFWFASLR